VLASLVKNSDLTGEEIKELEEILRQRRRDKNE